MNELLAISDIAQGVGGMIFIVWLLLPGFPALIITAIILIIWMFAAWGIIDWIPSACGFSYIVSTYCSCLWSII